jgi:hypothetical protein
MLASRAPNRAGKAPGRRGGGGECTWELGREEWAPVKRIGAALRRAGGELRAVLRGRVGREGEGRGVERGSGPHFIGRRGKWRGRPRRWRRGRWPAPLMASGARWGGRVEAFREREGGGVGE